MKTYHGCERHLEGIDSREAKVRQFDVTRAGDQDVLWLQVPMYDAVTVKKIHTTQHLELQILKHKNKYTINIMSEKKSQYLLVFTLHLFHHLILHRV